MLILYVRNRFYKLKFLGEIQGEKCSNLYIWEIWGSYGENDDLISYETILNFTNKSKANLTIMKGGEHWFHKDEQIEFLNNWIKNLT